MQINEYLYFNIHIFNASSRLILIISLNFRAFKNKKEALEKHIRNSNNPKNRNKTISQKKFCLILKIKLLIFSTLLNG